MIDSYLILLRDGDQRIREEVSNIDRSDTLLPALFFLLALLNDPIDVIAQPRKLFRVAMKELEKVLLILNIIKDYLDLEDAILIESEVDVGAIPS